MLAQGVIFDLRKRALRLKAAALAAAGFLILAFVAPVLLESSESASCIPLFSPSRAQDTVPSEAADAALQGACTDRGHRIEERLTTAEVSRGYPRG